MLVIFGMRCRVVAGTSISSLLFLPCLYMKKIYENLNVLDICDREFELIGVSWH